jgi:NADH-quinone oxidoreductase subunit C
LPSDAETTEAPAEEAVVDEARQALLDAIVAELGEAVVGQHLDPGRDVWVRVSLDSWADTADYLRNRQRFRFFDWLSAVDWLPSPFGRSLDAAVDTAQEADADDASADDAKDDGLPEGLPVAGGSSRFQVMARVYNLATGVGLNLRADVDNDELVAPSWIGTYPGAAWHEREAHEMFGITFSGNPDMRNLYLPTGFEGHPLRKDFPLLSRLIKPWPGIVDVEPMPELDSPSAENPEASS